MRNLKKLTALALSVAFASSCIVAAVPAVVAAENEVENKVEVPQAIATYDFQNGLDEILEKDSNASIVNSEKIYVRKNMEELVTGESLDANGLVYTGVGADATYVTKKAVGEPKVVADTQKGTVLQYNDTIVDVSKYMKTASASIEDDTEATKALDKQIRLNDYYYIEGYYEDALDTQEVAPALRVSNPFAGLGEQLKEYEETDDVTLTKVDNRYVPLWEKGVTISYWVKAPVDEDGKALNASVLRWENDNQYYYQADDYAKYLTCKKFEDNYAKMTDAQKAEALKQSPSGVFSHRKAVSVSGEALLPEKHIYQLYDYYFEYEDGWYETTTDGAIVPILYTDDAGFSGPVYNYALIEEMNAAGTARFYYANPNYKDGFFQMQDGSMMKMPRESYYMAGYSTLPVVSGDALAADDGNSMVRYGLVDGELQIDADNSIFWAPSREASINENTNTEGYGESLYLQARNYFTMNSWKNERDTSGKVVAFLADSAFSEIEKVNVGTWHHVAITMQNDWVEFYIDGKCADVFSNYSSYGGAGLDDAGLFTGFNKSFGLRYQYGSRDVTYDNISYGKYVCRLLMDWISDENAYLNFGGIGNQAGDNYLSMNASKVCIDDVQFYGQVLTEEQIKQVYSDTMLEVQIGDANGDGIVTLDDANLALKIALGIIEGDAIAMKACDIITDNKVDLADAQMVLFLSLAIDVS